MGRKILAYCLVLTNKILGAQLALYQYINPTSKVVSEKTGNQQV